MSDPVINNGYILMSRKILESGIMQKPPLYFKVWAYILLNAQHKDYKGLKRGQLWTSMPDIQEAMAYKVGYRIEKPSIKEIRGVLDYLRNPDEGNNEGQDKGAMIVTTKGTHGMLVTVLNYDVYQSPQNYEGQNEGHNENPTKEQRRAEQGHNINKNVKNDNNVQEDINNTFIYNEWMKTKEKLELDLAPSSYSTWIKPLVPLKLENNTLILQAPNETTKSTCEAKFAGCIKETFSRYIGKDIENINFIIEN